MPRTLLVGGALAMLACGGDADGDGDGFVERASRICAALPAELADPATATADDAELARHAIAELRQLDAPPGEEDVIAGALTSWEEYLDEVEDGGAVHRWVLDSAHEAHNVFAEAGLDECAAHLPHQGPPTG